jgi:conjugal transfer/entry exclusion protein
VGKRQDRIEALVSRWRRLSFKVGKIALFLRRLFDEVHYRPSNEGFRVCKRRYENTLQQYARA